LPELRVADLVEATGGTLLRGNPEDRVTSYAIDTRRMRGNGAFFALKGTRADGHRFLADAARHGATVAVVHENVDDGGQAPSALIRVKDTTAALGDCGAWVRRRLSKMKVVAITGSIGKTTTKELAAVGLAAGRRVHRNVGNLNNHLGVPLTFLACPDDTEIGVFELGMNGPGEIAYLARMCRPDVGLVLNVRPAHMEFFRTLDDVAAAKGELFAVLSPEAVSVVNQDDPHVRLQSQRHDGPRVTFGRNVQSDLRLESVDDRFVPGATLRYRFRNGTRKVPLRIGGTHAASDALAALAVVQAAGGDLEAAAEEMGRLEAGPGRGRVLHLANGAQLVDDSYNSNPAAMESVLETMRNTSCAGRKILVMGDMLELGAQTRTYHHEAGRRAAAAGVEVMIGVGPLTRTSLESARRSGVKEVHHEKDAVAAAKYLAGRMQSGDLVVVKGSRGVHLDRLVDEIASGRKMTGEDS